MRRVGWGRNAAMGPTVATSAKIASQNWVD